MYILFVKVGDTMSDSIPSIPLEPPISIPSTPLEPAEQTSFIYSEIPNFYNRVRFSINTNPSIVSDEMIDYFENAPMAELAMRQRVPIWKKLNEFKTQLYQTCIIYMTCYHLCPTVSSHGKITEQTTPSLTLKYDVGNSDGSNCGRFLWLIDDLVSQILEEEPKYFFGFKVTKEYPDCGCKQVWSGWNKNAFTPLGSE